MNLIKLPLLIISLFLLSACSSAVKDPAVIYKNQSEEQIFQGGETNLAKHDYGTAIKQFEALDALYPFGKHDEQIQLDLMYAYYQNNDLPSAAATADRFMRLYPRSERVDYAYYMKGLADFYQDRGWIARYFPTDLSRRDPGTMLLAFNDFNRLLQLFPDSRYAPDARQRMIYLRNMFASSEVHAANYYFQRGAYIAAANRASYVLQHYQGTPQVQDALGIMVKSYRALGLNDLAEQSLQVLALNFPADPLLAAAKKASGKK